mgnify:CR=1 FL=1
MSIAGGFMRFTENDSGSKYRAKKATDDLAPEITKQLKWRLKAWWWNVLQEAKGLCMAWAFDTGTLWRSIRIEKKTSSLAMGAPTWMVILSPKNKLIDSMIVAGGAEYVNPKTHNGCNYAESVHDGTGRNLSKGERPFLRVAIELHMNELDHIIQEGLTKAINTVWVGS